MSDSEDRQFGPGEFEEELLDVLFKAKICTRYYEICKWYPIRSRISKYKLQEAIERAKGTIALSKVKGLGTIIGIDDVPHGTELLLILQHSSVAETEISFTFRGRAITTTFAILCKCAAIHTGIPNSPYPRPSYTSVRELIEIAEALRYVFLDIINAIRACESGVDIPISIDPNPPRPVQLLARKLSNFLQTRD